MRTRIILGIVGSALLAGCADSSSRIMGAGPSAGCHAVGAQAMLGQTFDEHVLQEALRGSGALRSRVLPDGAVPTFGDADPMRLNIELDADRRIRRMRCG